MEGCCPTTEHVYVYAHDCAPRFYLQKHTPMMKSRYLFIQLVTIELRVIYGQWPYSVDFIDLLCVLTSVQER
jgi:hypothetical protein